MALAFGLGGREVAGQMLGDAYDKGRENKGQVKDDMALAKERGQERAEQGKAKTQEKLGTAGNGPGQDAPLPGSGAYRP